jgi:hypothetical protein
MRVSNRCFGCQRTTQIEVCAECAFSAVKQRKRQSRFTNTAITPDNTRRIGEPTCVYSVALHLRSNAGGGSSVSTRANARSWSRDARESHPEARSSPSFIKTPPRRTSKQRQKVTERIPLTSTLGGEDRKGSGSTRLSDPEKSPVLRDKRQERHVRTGQPPVARPGARTRSSPTQAADIAQSRSARAESSATAVGFAARSFS